MNKTTSRLIVSAASALLIAAPATFARSGKTSGGESSTNATSTNTTSSHAMADAQFAKNAADGGLTEVKLGQLAEDRGASQAVKDFGKRMVTDHSKADDALKNAASSDKITLPTEIEAKDESVYNRFSKLSGAAFDRAYARDMVRDHQADIAAFREEAKDGKDASIKSFASQTLPTLEDHLKQAREMLSGVSSANHSQTKKQQS